MTKTAGVLTGRGLLECRERFPETVLAAPLLIVGFGHDDDIGRRGDDSLVAELT